MAKGKGKGTASAGPRKSHGTKRHMHRWCGAMKRDFAKAGLLSKYHDYESWCLACSAKGKRDLSHSEFMKFCSLPHEKQVEYFKSIGRK